MYTPLPSCVQHINITQNKCVPCTGVYLNGRQFTKDTHFEYVKRTRVGQVALAGHPDSYGIGTVNRFYNLHGADGKHRLFCSFFVRKVQGRDGDLYTIESDIPQSQKTEIMYVDSIVRQVHLAPIIPLPVPKDDDEKNDDTAESIFPENAPGSFVGIPMWDVR